MPILCKVNRGDFIESMHVAFVVVVDSKGSIVYSNGDAHYLTCVRSALKPFQASASVKAGAIKKFDFSKIIIPLLISMKSFLLGLFFEKIHYFNESTGLKKNDVIK